MASRHSIIIGLLIFAVMLDDHGGLRRMVIAEPANLHDSDLKIQNLQAEVLKLHKLIEKNFKQPNVSTKKVETTTYKEPTPTIKSKMVAEESGNVEGELNKFHSGAQEGSGLDLKDLQKEIEKLQMQLIEDVTQKSVEKPNKKTEKLRSSAHSNRPHIKQPQSGNEMYYHIPYYPYQNYALKLDKSKLKKDEETQETDDDDDLLEPTEDDSKKRLVEGSTKSTVLELVLEVLKLFAGGDGKNLISLALKIVPAVLKGLLSGITTSISKGGLKGLLIRYIVPLIVLGGVNLLIVFMAWWLWDESSCKEELDSKPYGQPPSGYGLSPVFY